MSNQSGISLKNAGGPKIKSDRFMQFKQKAGAVFNSLNIPISVYAATEKDHFRKPMIGMWVEFLKDQQLENVDLANSIFVGDAGGRIAGTFNGQTYKADFACSDRFVVVKLFFRLTLGRNFASNAGIQFKSPEEFFLDESPREFLQSFDPLQYALSTTAEPLFHSQFARQTKPEVVVFVGSPGAGKSTFFAKFLEPLGYKRVNQDTLKSVSRHSCKS
jgi:bifunctional polynucleotide phosphatase/kinase